MFKRISTVLFLLALLSLSTLLITKLSPLPGQASPDDVRGSANVAVTGFQNSKGSFVLWSNGRISNLQGNVVNQHTNYTAVNNFRMPQIITGNILGSRNVAVDALVNNQGTFIVFSDGSIRKPTNVDAAAPSSSAKILACTIKLRSGSLQSITSKVGNIDVSYGRPIRVSFNNSFSAMPTLSVTPSYVGFDDQATYSVTRNRPNEMLLTVGNGIRELNIIAAGQ